jgi:hypothetical protein
LVVLVSQPLAALPSQLPKPALHAPSTHAPPEHVDAALARAQAIPQPPQFAVLVAVLASQPFIALPSQLAKPVLQAPSAQLPPAQVAPAFAKEQAIPQPPQFIALERVSVSQPFIALLSQLAKPALQAPSAQLPPAQLAAAFAKEHTVPQVPQFITLALVSVSQPLAGFMSQLPKPVAQALTPQVPSAQVCVATLARAHARPQAPQFATLVCRSTQAIPQRVFGHVDAQAPLTQA